MLHNFPFIIAVKSRRIDVVFVVLGPFHTKDGVLAGGPLEVTLVPLVFWAAGFTDAFDPGVERAEMVLDGVVAFADELVTIEVLNLPLLQPRPYRLLPRLPTRKYLHMHHIMLLRLAVLIIHRGVEYQVTRL